MLRKEEKLLINNSNFFFLIFLFFLFLRKSYKLFLIGKKMSITDLVGVKDATAFAVAEEEVPKVMIKPACEYAEKVDDVVASLINCYHPKDNCINVMHWEGEKKCMNPVGYTPNHNPKTLFPVLQQRYLH